MLNVVILSVIMLSVIMLSVIMLSVIMLSVIMLSVIMLSVIMLIVEKSLVLFLSGGGNWYSLTTHSPQDQCYATFYFRNFQWTKLARLLRPLQAFSAWSNV